MSADDLETQKRFKRELEAPFPFVSDPQGKLIALYDVKTPIITLAKRVTFVIGQDRKIARIDTGSDAIDPATAISAAQAVCGGR